MAALGNEYRCIYNTLASTPLPAPNSLLSSHTGLPLNIKPVPTSGLFTSCSFYVRMLILDLCLDPYHSDLSSNVTLLEIPTSAICSKVASQTLCITSPYFNFFFFAIDTICCFLIMYVFMASVTGTRTFTHLTLKFPKLHCLAG